MTTVSQNYYNLGNTKAMTKMLLPSLELTIVTINFLSTNLKIALKTLQIENLKKKKRKVLLTMRQPKKLRNMLIRVRFETKTIPKSPKLTRLILCNNCVYHVLSLIHHFQLN